MMSGYHRHGGARASEVRLRDHHVRILPPLTPITEESFVRTPLSDHGFHDFMPSAVTLPVITNHKKDVRSRSRSKSRRSKRRYSLLGGSADDVVQSYLDSAAYHTDGKPLLDPRAPFCWCCRDVNMINNTKRQPDTPRPGHDPEVQPSYMLHPLATHRVGMRGDPYQGHRHPDDNARLQTSYRPVSHPPATHRVGMIGEYSRRGVDITDSPPTVPLISSSVFKWGTPHDDVDNREGQRVGYRDRLLEFYIRERDMRSLSPTAAGNMAEGVVGASARYTEAMYKLEKIKL